MEWIKKEDKDPPVDTEIFVWHDNDLNIPSVAYWNKKEGFYQFDLDDYSLNESEFLHLANVTHWCKPIPPGK